MTLPDLARAELRKLPKADRLLEAAARSGFVARVGHDAVMDAVHSLLEGLRQVVRQGAPCPDEATIERDLVLRLEDDARGTLRRVVNATGVVIHTNLGRAPLSDQTKEAMRLAAGYGTLEYDLAKGERGDRHIHAEAAICRLCGSQAAAVVNNNAAGVLLALAALADSRPSGDAPVDGAAEVVVSRGQLVEIGGGFRIPDVLRRSGMTLVEVGTTNRTYLRDYEQAIGPRTRVLLSVHRSNFRQEGFVHEPELFELGQLAKDRDLWLVDDLGSGTLIETAPFGLGVEPPVPSRVSGGADLVCFSGDKLLGGPQSGLLVGKKEAVHRLKSHPLMRAFRCDKVTLAGLSATLGHYARKEAVEKIPVWRALALSPDELLVRAREWLSALGEPALAAVVATSSAVGGGSLPGVTLPTHALALSAAHPDALHAALRRSDPPVIGRIEGGEVLLDPRTVLPGEDDELVNAVRAALL